MVGLPGRCGAEQPGTQTISQEALASKGSFWDDTAFLLALRSFWPSARRQCDDSTFVIKLGNSGSLLTTLVVETSGPLSRLPSGSGSGVLSHDSSSITADSPLGQTCTVGRSNLCDRCAFARCVSRRRFGGPMEHKRRDGYR